MKLFLQQVAERLLELQHQHKNLRIVLPNQRAGLFLKQEIAKLVHQPIFLPKISTIEDFFYELSGLQKVEQTEQIFRLYESHKETAKEPHSFDKFLRWATTFLSDCSEIDTNLIDTNTFFRTLYNDREIRNWNINEGLTEMQEDYLEFWKIAEQLYNHFTKKLLNENKAYNGLAYRYACENINQNYNKLQNDYVVFVAFNALNRAEEALFNYVYENNIGEFIWDIDNYYLNDVENKAGQYFRNYREQWKSDKSLTNSTNKIGNNTEQMVVLEAPNFIAQADIAAQLILHLEQQGKIIGRNTAIILGDETLLEPLLFSLPKNQMYNVTMGKAVNKFSLFHLFDNYLRLLSLFESDNSGYPTGVLTPILASPFVHLLDLKNDCESLNNYIIENNVAFLSLEKIHQLVGDSFIYKLLQNKGTITGTLTQLNWFIEQLRSQFQNERIQKQVLFELKKIFNQFESLYSKYPIPTTIPAFRNLFQQVCIGTTIPYEGEPLQGIQIMGVLETRALDFENVILLGCNEGTLPKGKSGTSFIPYIFKEHFNIQTFKDKDAIYAYSFYRLLHTAKNITFIYNGQSGSTGGGEQSRFITQLEAEFNLKTNSKVAIKHQFCNYKPFVEKPNEYIIEKTDEIFAQIEDYITNKYLSPSSIKTLINNPLDFYFNKIARIKEPKQIEKDIELNTFGTIVHEVLENLYTPAIGKPLTKEFLENIKENIETEVHAVYLKNYKKGNTSKGLNLLMKKASYALVRQTIETDLKRIQQHHITITALEENLEVLLPVYANGKNYNVVIRGNADRIQKRDDVLEIIDYKTGNVDSRKLQSTHIENIHIKPDLEKLHQILCYTYMAHEGKLKIPLEKIHAGMQPLKSWNDQIIFINDKKADNVISKKELDIYKEQLKLVIQQLLNKEQPFVVPKEDRLKHSNYKGIYV